MADTKYIVKMRKAYQPYKMGEEVGMTKEAAAAWTEGEYADLMRIVETTKVFTNKADEPEEFHLEHKEIWNRSQGRISPLKKAAFVDPLADSEDDNELVAEEPQTPRKRRGRPRKQASSSQESPSGGEE